MARQTEPTEPFGDTLLDLFWSCVKRGSGRNACWEWRSHRNTGGYGIFTFLGKDILAHRVSYAIEVGEVRPGFQVCHHCDNPRCVRPSHLFQGTSYDNCQDAKNKGRTRAPRGEAHRSVILNEDDVRFVHASRESDEFLMKKFGISRSCIKKLRSGRSWKHLGLGKAYDRRDGR